MNRLEVIAPGLFQMLRKADSAKLTALKIAACDYVFPVLKLTGEESKLLFEARTCLIETGKLPDKLRSKIEDLADAMDAQYFPLYEADPQNKDAYMPFFTQACALHAMSYAGENDPYESAVEAIYEAAQAAENRSTFLEYLEAMARTDNR